MSIAREALLQFSPSRCDVVTIGAVGSSVVVKTTIYGDVDEILAALAPFFQQWEPIENAPKDGTLFIVTNANAPYDTMLMRSDTLAMLQRPNTPKHLQPPIYTHFMRLPSPPKPKDTQTINIKTENKNG
jgi:hypothetical protein